MGSQLVERALHVHECLPDHRNISERCLGIGAVRGTLVAAAYCDGWPCCMTRRPPFR